jgi:hypothetical protein
MQPKSSKYAETGITSSAKPNAVGAISVAKRIQYLLLGFTVASALFLTVLLTDITAGVPGFILLFVILNILWLAYSRVKNNQYQKYIFLGALVGSVSTVALYIVVVIFLMVTAPI